MNEKLYESMDWPAVEAIVYSEDDRPHDTLGAHLTEDGIKFQAFFPGAREVYVLIGSAQKSYQMDCEDEAGFFAALIPGKAIPSYRYRAFLEDGTVEEYLDPYAFPPQIPEKECEKFNQGINYEIYRYLGAHKKTVKGVKGVSFAVWAPYAMRVSVVGDFNHWDGRRLPMRRLYNSGIFELFVPGLKEGTLYKFEIKAKGGLTYLKADPYANASELRPDTASIVTDLSGFAWEDEAWLSKRKALKKQPKPLAILEVHLGTFKKPDDGREFFNYRELAPLIAGYAKETGYNYVELLPVMEHFSDESYGYDVTGYYAPTARYGSPEDFMYFMNYLHLEGIGVILDWVPSHFPRDVHGLSAFDGTYLYEHRNPKQGVHPEYGTLLYNYGRPEVSNFLIANALFWKKVYHADGLRIGSVASMLYLDYDRAPGEWIPNREGGNVNLDALEFLKHLNSIFKKPADGALLIAEDSSMWPKITAPLKDGGLGFDYKWDKGFTDDFLGYMQLDPIFRAAHHDELTYSMDYHYSEKFLLSLSHDEVVSGRGTMLSDMPGKRRMKFANLRAAYGFLICHPGAKLLFAGQDLGFSAPWDGIRALDWTQLADEDVKGMQQYMRSLLKFYADHPALYEKDDVPAGFEWVSTNASNDNTLSFLRRSAKEELLIVLNFSPLVYEKYRTGVPYAGRYKEIFSSDRKEYGGEGHLNPRLRTSAKLSCDEQENSIVINVPPMGIAVFDCKKGLAK